MLTLLVVILRPPVAATVLLVLCGGGTSGFVHPSATKRYRRSLPPPIDSWAFSDDIKVSCVDGGDRAGGRVRVAGKALGATNAPPANERGFIEHGRREALLNLITALRSAIISVPISMSALSAGAEESDPPECRGGAIVAGAG